MGQHMRGWHSKPVKDSEEAKQRLIEKLGINYIVGDVIETVSNGWVFKVTWNHRADSSQEQEWKVTKNGNCSRQ